MSVRRICLWSGPRNVSTALMYSFAQRSDTRVIDEPLYGHYLRVSGAPHPMRAEVLAAMELDGECVVRETILGPCDRAVLFMKQMAHHLVELDLSFLGKTENILLIRNPRDMLPSLARSLGRPTLADSGLARQVELYEILDRRGRAPAVLDARLLLEDPRLVLGLLCASLDLRFEEAMLSWATGPRPEDGVWARHWYGSVHRSSGFGAYNACEEFPRELDSVLEECRPYYDQLLRHAMGPSTS